MKNKSISVAKQAHDLNQLDLQAQNVLGLPDINHKMQLRSKQQTRKSLVPADLTLKCVQLLTKKGKQSKATKIMNQIFLRLQNHIDAEHAQTSEAGIASNLLRETYASRYIDADAKYTSIAQTTPDNIFCQAVENIKPLFELRSIRLSGTPHQFPAVLSPQRQEKVALRWLIQNAQIKQRKRNSSQGLDWFLFREILDAWKKQGELRKRRDEIHRTAERNRGLIHRRWWP